MSEISLLIMPQNQAPAGIPGGRLVYAIGDIHGRIDLLDALLTQIVADGADLPAGKKMIVFLGDYVDRGPASTAVLDRLLDPPRDFDIVRLIGNHELMLRDVLDGKDEWLETWIGNGGDATLASYGLSGAPMAMLSRALRERMPAAHRRLLDELSPCHDEGDYFFAHAGIRPGIALAAQTLEDLVWIRKPFLHSDAEWGRIVVHGHSITPEVVFKPNRIGIDTGAYRTGRLSALRLEGSDRRIIQAADH